MSDKSKEYYLVLKREFLETPEFTTVGRLYEDKENAYRLKAQLEQDSRRYLVGKITLLDEE